MDLCFYCHQMREVRPYGPGGVYICFPCMKADPEREKRAGEIFAGKLNVHPVTLQTQEGPIPYIGTIPRKEDEEC